MWFNPSHDHDLGAVQSSIVYIIPKWFREHLWLPTDNEANSLVNMNSTTADERGVDYIKVNP